MGQCENTGEIIPKLSCKPGFFFCYTNPTIQHRVQSFFEVAFLDFENCTLIFQQLSQAVWNFAPDQVAVKGMKFKEFWMIFFINIQSYKFSPDFLNFEIYIFFYSNEIYFLNCFYIKGFCKQQFFLKVPSFLWLTMDLKLIQFRTKLQTTDWFVYFLPRLRQKRCEMAKCD